jgi:hypothetical protein
MVMGGRCTENEKNPVMVVWFAQKFPYYWGEDFSDEFLLIRFSLQVFPSWLLHFS